MGLLRKWIENGPVLTTKGLKRRREREHAELVREQRAELARQREEREREAAG